MKFLISLALLLFSVHSFALNKPVAAPEPALVDVDISGSSGNYNGQSYSEIHLGVNLNFTEWLTWRNSAFKRFSSGSTQDISGLDSSLRFVLNTPFENGAFKIFAGPGYRLASPSDKNALLGEAGASLELGRLNLSVGAKYLRYDQAQLGPTGAELKRDDLSYFVTISGGAGFSFGSSF